MFATRQEEEVGISGWYEVRIEDDDDDHPPPWALAVGLQQGYGPWKHPGPHYH
jgi:hypothetical protein